MNPDKAKILSQFRRQEKAAQSALWEAGESNETFGFFQSMLPFRANPYLVRTSLQAAVKAPCEVRERIEWIEMLSVTYVRKLPVSVVVAKRLRPGWACETGNAIYSQYTFHAYGPQPGGVYEHDSGVILSGHATKAVTLHDLRHLPEEVRNHRRPEVWLAPGFFAARVSPGAGDEHVWEYPLSRGEIDRMGYTLLDRPRKLAEAENRPFGIIDPFEYVEAVTIDDAEYAEADRANRL